MPIEEAKKLGAMALFGEKYGNVVRVVKAGDFSTELCGGTHVDNTGKLGLFKIVSESSVAAGVRRIEGVTGTGVIDFINKNSEIMNKTAAALKTGNVSDMERRAVSVMAEIKALEKEVDSLSSQLSSIKAGSIMDNAVEIKGIKLITAALDSTTADEIRSLCDNAKASADNVVVVIGGVNDKGTASIAAACAPEAVKLGAHAGNIVREVAKIVGGSGGGRPDGAMAGGKDASKIKEAVSSAESVVSAMLK